MFARVYHRILLKLRIRKAADWAGPELGPEVNHPYFAAPGAFACCEHCGGGRFHAIHKEPWDERRTREILGSDWGLGAEAARVYGPKPNDATQAGC